MRFLPFIFANLFRKKIRTVLTVGSFAVALFLFGLLFVVRGAFTGGVDIAGADRLVTINRTSIIQPLPLSYRDRLLKIRVVKQVTFANWFGGVYQDERNFFGNGFVGWYTIRIDNPDRAVEIVKASDQEFVNSPCETKTDTEKAFAASWVKQFGNIQFLILTIGGVVFFTLLLVTGNTMAIAVRERIGELAVLKAIGYSDGFVLRLILAESLMVAAVGGVLGMLLAKLFTLAGDPTRGLLPFFYLPASAIVAGMVTAFAVGIIAGILPAVSRMRLRV